MKNYRHGDLALIGIEKLPEGLTKSDSKILMTGSHGNNHEFDNGEFYPKRVNDFIFGYFVSNNTTLKHPDHGDKNINGFKYSKIVNKVYELRNQIEDTNEGMRKVED